jgi:hypothetical protein
MSARRKQAKASVLTSPKALPQYSREVEAFIMSLARMAVLLAEIKAIRAQG